MPDEWWKKNERYTQQDYNPMQWGYQGPKNAAQRAQTNLWMQQARPAQSWQDSQRRLYDGRMGMAGYKKK